MTEVFQPLNDRAAEIVTKNADLLEGSSMQPLLLQLVAHVFAYRVIIKRYAPSGKRLQGSLLLGLRADALLGLSPALCMASSGNREVCFCRWEEGNISEWSTVTYPDGLLEWAEIEFSRMKERQAKLLGIKRDSGQALALPAPLSKL